MNTITTKIHFLAIDIFKKAIKHVNKEYEGKLEIISQVDKEFNTIEIKVESKNPMDFYNLGRTFGLYLQEL